MTTVPDFYLTPQQQQLLFAALNANRGGAAANGNALTLSPNALTDTPATTKPADLTANGLLESPFLDYDYSLDAGDNSLDYSVNDGDQSNYPENLADGTSSGSTRTESNADQESPDKRSHPDDEDDAATAKRRESGEKVPKKPGRKPLTAEPSSKRKAQNRAAQRAFRERKEKHLKDLETKISELEKATESANSENSQLRSQIEKMSVELAEYKKQVALLSSSRPAGQTFGRAPFNSVNDVSFQFEFPKFGQLPGPQPPTNGTSPSAGTSGVRAPSLDVSVSPSTASNTGKATNTVATSSQSSPATEMPMYGGGLSKSTVGKSSDANSSANVRTSMDSSTSSPSSSSHSAPGASSSCGTSPESSNHSPLGFKPVDALATIGEEQSTLLGDASGQDVSHFANVDISDMSWLGNQTDFNFDPQLFGNYREPQESILAAGGFDDSFFNDALDVDFITPFNLPPSPIVHKTNLIAQIDAAKEGEFSSSSLAPGKDAAGTGTGAPGTALLTCNKIWEKLQECDRVQSGDFDLDSLCQDLQKKAKCSGNGAVINESDFRSVMEKHLSKPTGECISSLLKGSQPVPSS